MDTLGILAGVIIGALIVLLSRWAAGRAAFPEKKAPELFARASEWLPPRPRGAPSPSKLEGLGWGDR